MPWAVIVVMPMVRDATPPGCSRAPPGRTTSTLVARTPQRVDLGDLDGHLRRTEPGRETPQPVGGRPGCDERAEEHVAADSGGRIEDSKTAISHRLINMAAAQTGGKPPGSR